jgi:hypothetical protein
MADLIIQEDGTIIAPLDKDWRIVTPEAAVLLKVIHPNGDVRFYYPQHPKESA